MTDWGQLRICVEQTLPHQQAEIDKLCDKCNSQQHAQILRAAYLKRNIWPLKRDDGSPTVITIQFLEDGNSVDWTPLSSLEGRDQNGNPIQPDPLNNELFRKVSPREMVETVVRKRIMPIIGLKLKFVDQEGMIRISFDPQQGAYSQLGTACLGVQAGKPTMNLGWLDVGTVTHEFLHAIGAVHEHQNPRGRDIEWNEQRLFEWSKNTQGWNKKTTTTNIINTYELDQINGSTYDPHSVMLYFYPGYLTSDNKGTSQNVRLSPMDVVWMQKIYPGGKLSPQDFYHNTYKVVFHQKSGTEDNPIYVPDDVSRGDTGNGIGKLIGIIIGSIVGAVLLGVILWLFITKVNWRRY
jgi:hypothetical protein